MTFKISDGRFSASTEGDCKQIVVDGPNNFDLLIEIDYDDVNHETTKDDTRRLISLLEEHWPR